MSHSFLSASGVGYTRERRKHLLPKSLDDVNLSDYTTGKGESFVLADAILSRRIPRAVQSYGDSDNMEYFRGIGYNLNY